MFQNIIFVIYFDNIPIYRGAVSDRFGKRWKWDVESVLYGKLGTSFFEIYSMGSDVQHTSGILHSDLAPKISSHHQ